jgi:predicted metal-binding membrane protein
MLRLQTGAAVGYVINLRLVPIRSKAFGRSVPKTIVNNTRALRLQNNAILALLLAIAVAAWTVLVWHQGHHARMDVPMAAPALYREVSHFLADWTVMMVAMMFPVAAPMAIAFHKMKVAKRPRENAFTSTCVFVSAYLLVWAIAGFAAYAGLLIARYVSAHAILPTAVAAQFGGAIIFTAGFYQITPLKEFCLSKCRTPIAFITDSWREGSAGAFRMGLLHGVYCVGCCWLLFVILFPLGMTLISMVAVTAIILSERWIVSWSEPMSHVAGVALVFYGALVIISHQVLPIPNLGEMTMPAEMAMPAGMTMPANGSAPHDR